MTIDYLILAGAIFVLLILSAFFSGSETALTRASLPRMHELARQGNRRAELVLALYEQRERLIGAILFGIIWSIFCRPPGDDSASVDLRRCGNRLLATVVRRSGADFR